jgi:hypothetical protein
MYFRIIRYCHESRESPFKSRLSFHPDEPSILFATATCSYQSGKVGSLLQAFIDHQLELQHKAHSLPMAWIKLLVAHCHSGREEEYCDPGPSAQE